MNRIATAIHVTILTIIACMALAVPTSADATTLTTATNAPTRCATIDTGQNTAAWTFKGHPRTATYRDNGTEIRWSRPIPVIVLRAFRQAVAYARATTPQPLRSTVCE